MAEMRRVTAIRNGTVIDHIPAGHALQVIQMLHIVDKTPFQCFLQEIGRAHV